MGTTDNLTLVEWLKERITAWKADRRTFEDTLLELVSEISKRLEEGNERGRRES
jgi:hypothetical protein